MCCAVVYPLQHANSTTACKLCKGVIPPGERQRQRQRRKEKATLANVTFGDSLALLLFLAEEVV